MQNQRTGPISDPQQVAPIVAQTEGEQWLWYGRELNRHAARANELGAELDALKAAAAELVARWRADAHKEIASRLVYACADDLAGLIGGLSPEQADGLACVVCAQQHGTEGMVPTGARGPLGAQLFAHARCLRGTSTP